MFHNILVPLDGSPLAESALPHAEALATTFDAKLLLLRVIPLRQRGGAVPMDIIDRRLCQAEAQAYLDALVEGLRNRKVTADTEVVQGQPAERIVEVLRSQAVDLLVLTTHGVGGWTEFPVSGTAHKVISRSPVSVLIVPTSESAPGNAVARQPYKRILVGLDGSRRGEWALGPASILARAAAAELVLAHVVQIPEIVEEPLSVELHTAAEHLIQLNTHAAATHLEDVKSHLESPELRVRTRLEISANVPETLAEIAESENADLVVLTAHGASLSTGRRYGAIALQVLTHARRPLLVAQDAARRLDVQRTAPAWRRDTAPNHR